MTLSLLHAEPVVAGHASAVSRGVTEEKLDEMLND